MWGDMAYYVPTVWKSGGTRMGGETFFKVGGTSAREKSIENFCGLNWQLWRHKHWNIASLPIHHVKV